ncbi:amidohydrolase family protein [Sorangium sp. So ce296]|uniref:amidohydrolase family protein n=1 Tax=Sorangium sp. So ce296 TaxID=3133296 RepID=UPI003F642A34
MSFRLRVCLLAALAGLCACASAPVQWPSPEGPPKLPPARELNPPARPDAAHSVAIVGATLVDGRGGPPVRDAVVVVRGDRVVAAGARAATDVPAGAELVRGAGLWVLPGLIDAHFHLGGDDGLPGLVLRRGVTSLREPGNWIEAYDAARRLGPVPRLFLTGPMLDAPAPAYPESAMLVRDAAEARWAVEQLVERGASGIKVYFRLPLGLVEAVAQTAHARGVVAVGHLETVDAAAAARAGLDGIEHITSLGTALVPPREAERYRQSVIAENEARFPGRYEIFRGISLEAPRTAQLLRLLAARGTFVTPTLAIFERRAGGQGVTDVEVRGFETMMKLTAAARRAGVRVVVGSHGAVPGAARGWAYQREMELLVESGLSPMEVLVAATLENARYLRIDDRLGSVEPGKLADLVLLEGDPLADIRAMRRVNRVMLNGRWVASPQGDHPPTSQNSSLVVRPR